MGTAESALKTLDGVEASRRVGWAKFYELQELLEHIQDQHRKDLFFTKSLIERLCDGIIHHSRLCNDDPLVQLAQKIFKELV